MKINEKDLLFLNNQTINSVYAEVITIIKTLVNSITTIIVVSKFYD